MGEKGEGFGFVGRGLRDGEAGGGGRRPLFRGRRGGAGAKPHATSWRSCFVFGIFLGARILCGHDTGSDFACAVSLGAFVSFLIYLLCF